MKDGILSGVGMEDDGSYAAPSLEETFYILSKKNTVYRVKLSEKGLCMQKESNGTVKTETIGLCDIVGCRCMRSRRGRSNQSCTSWTPSNKRKYSPRVVEEHSLDRDESDTSAYLYIYAYVLKKSKVKSHKKRDRVVITLRFRSYDRYDDNIKEAHKWKVTIKFLLQTHLSPSLPSCFFRTTNQNLDGKILVIVNPKSGVGKAREVFQNKVVPILTEADISYDLHVTTASGEARAFVTSQNLWEYMGGVVVVGGDGILNEVVNGVLERADWQPILRDLKFGIVPCGSGNGLAKSISYAFGEPHDYNPVLVSALNVARCVASPMDLVRVEMKHAVLYSFLSVGWGLLADIDIESEVLRNLGSPRFTIYSVARLIGLRTYKGTVSYLPISSNRARTCSTNSEEFGDDPQLNEESRRDSFYSVCSRKSTYLSAAGSSYESLSEECARSFGPASSLPPLSQPLPSNWEVISGEFVLVQAAYQTHLATDVLISPSAKLDDATIWLAIIRAGISRHHLLQFLLGLSSGSHLGVPETEVVQVSAFRIEPEPGSGSQGSHMTVDGELVQVGPIQGYVLPSACQVFARPR